MKIDICQLLLKKTNIGYALYKIEVIDNEVIDGQLIDLNSIYEDYIGKKRDDVINQKASFIFNEDQAYLKILLNSLMSSHKTGMYSQEQDRNYLVERMKVSDDTFLLYFIDNRKFYQYSRENEELYHIASIGKWELNIKTGEIDWSEGIYEMFEQKMATFSPTYENFFKIIHPEDVNLVKETFEQAVFTKRGYDIDHRLLLSNGKIKWVNETGHINYDDKGSPSKAIGVVQDITKRKELEQQLRNSEERYKVIFDKAAIGIANISVEGRLLNANQKFCEMLGYSYEEVKKLNENDIIYFPDLPKNQEMIKKLFSGEIEIINMEKRYVKKDGSVIWADVRSNLIKDLSNLPKCFISSISDITAKKISEQKLHESEQYLKRAQKIAKVGNWEIDLSTGNMKGSEEAYSIYGLKEESEFIPLEKIQKFVKQHDRTRMNEALSGLINKKSEYDIVFTITRENDGKERVIHSMAVLVENDGKPIKVTGVIRDITEQKTLENELKESVRSKNILLSNLPGMAYRCKFDREWTMSYVSRGCFELTGYEPYELIDNYKVSYNDLILPEYREIIYSSWERAVEKKTFSKEEYRIKTADGSIKWVWEQGQPIFDIQQKVIAIEGFITDITERKEREKEVAYLSYHDQLTGLYNRAFFDAELKRLNTKRQLPISIIMGDINGLKLTNDLFGHAEGDRLIKTVSTLIVRCCRAEDIVARIGGDEFCVILPKTDYLMAKSISERITRLSRKYKTKEENTIIPSISFGFATKNAEEVKIESVLREAEQLMYKRKLLEQKSSHSSIISSMRDTMAEKSNETKEHAERMIMLTIKLGKKMNLEEKYLNEIELLATLHDIGKMSIDNRILNKKEKLTEEEWFEIKKHPEAGYRIAKSSITLFPIAEYILAHHERYDGTGYPQGLKGEEIPLLSRILAIVDAYDAMTNSRPYREVLTKEEAIEELTACAGTQFDPNLIQKFIEIV